jgi:hypothetical protein
MYINYIMISKPLVVPHRGFSINHVRGMTSKTSMGKT